MEGIELDLYLKRLISKKHNGKVKIVIGIRLCDKSYSLRHIFFKKMVITSGNSRLYTDDSGIT